MSVYNRIPSEPSGEEAAGSGPEEQPSGEGRSAGSSTAQAFSQLSALFTELKDYASYYVAAKLDGIKWSLTRVGIFAAIGVLGLIVGGALLITASVLFLTGLANGLGRAFNPDMIWLGWIIVGGLVLLATGIGVAIGLSALTKGTQRRMVEKYENKRRRQQVEYGNNVRGRAASAPESVGSA